MSFDLKIQDGDLLLSNTNDLAKVEKSDKLVQDIIKMIATKLGANKFYPWYGSPIASTLIGSSFDTRFVSSIASNQLKTSLDTLKNLQQEQIKTSQVVTAQEQIAVVQNVKVDRNITDPRIFTVAVTVLNKAFRRTEIPLNIRI